MLANFVENSAHEIKKFCYKTRLEKDNYPNNPISDRAKGSISDLIEIRINFLITDKDSVNRELYIGY